MPTMQQRDRPGPHNLMAPHSEGHPTLIAVRGLISSVKMRIIDNSLRFSPGKGWTAFSLYSTLLRITSRIDSAITSKHNPFQYRGDRPAQDHHLTAIAHLKDSIYLRTYIELMVCMAQHRLLLQALMASRKSGDHAVTPPLGRRGLLPHQFISYQGSKLRLSSPADAVLRERISHSQ